MNFSVLASKVPVEHIYCKINKSCGRVEIEKEGGWVGVAEGEGVEGQKGVGGSKVNFSIAIM